jgi:chromosome segregation ATPase
MKESPSDKHAEKRGEPGLASRTYNFFSSKLLSVLRKIRGIQKVGKSELEVILSKLREDYSREISNSQKYVSNALNKHYDNLARQFSERTEKLQGILEEYTKITKDVQQKTEHIEQYNNRIAGIESQLKEIRENPLRLFGKDSSMQEIAESAIAKLENRAKEITEDLSKKITQAAEDDIQKVDAAIKARLPDIDERVAYVIDEIDGVHPGTIKETIERKQKRRHEIRRRNRVLGGVAGFIALGFLGLAGWTVYTSSKLTVEGAAGVADSAFKAAIHSMTAVNETKAQFETYKQEMNGKLSRYETKEEIEKKVSGLETRTKTEYDIRITGLDAQIADIKTNEAQVKGDIDTVKQVYPLLKDEIAKGHEYLQTIVENIGLYEKRLNGLTEQADALAKNSLTKEDFGRTITLLAKDLDDLKEEIRLYEGLDKKYDELNKKYETLQRSVEQLKTSQDASSVQLKLEH